jgi:hypothetical protein
MTDALTPLIRVLKPEHKRSVVGIDTLTITPPDQEGNQYITVIVNHFTKLTGLYPSKTHTAIDAAQALFQYCCTFGLIDSIISDPGSEFMNEVQSSSSTLCFSSLFFLCVFRVKCAERRRKREKK